MNETSSRSLSRARDAITIALFAVSLATPLAGSLLQRHDEDAAAELRKPTPPPQFPTSWDALSGFPTAVERWWKDAFGFRRTLVRWNNMADWWVFKTSPASASVPVLRGKGEWIFFTVAAGIQDFRGLDPFPPQHLVAWREVLEARAAWLAERGVKYVFAFAPEKQSIYPERMPDRYTRLGPTRLDRFLRCGAEAPNLRIVDLQDRLLRAKDEMAREGDIYYPLGSHWNDLGVVVAYGAILDAARAWFPIIEPHRLGDFRLTRIGDRSNQGDSWASRLYMEDLLLQENPVLSLLPRFRHGFKAGRNDTSDAPEQATEIGDPLLPRAVFFHDSFGKPLQPMLSEHFRRIAYVQSTFDPAVVEREKPDLVIEMMAERKLFSHRPAASPRESDARVNAAFDASRETLLKLDPKNPTAVFLGNEALEVLAAESFGRPAARLRPLRAGGSVRLREFAVPKEKFPSIRIELEATSAAELRIEFMTADERSYSSEMRSLRRSIRAGRNVIDLRLLVPDLYDALRFSLDRPGAFDVVSLEIRAVP